jgi:hypothetical protein
MDDQPVARYQTADGVLKSTRSVAGALRYGTMPNVGPRGDAITGGGNGTDFGMDRITPRGFDPMGTSLRREPNQEGSTLVSRDVRRR